MEKYELNLSERTSAGVTLVSVALLSGDITEHDLHGIRPLFYIGKANLPEDIERELRAAMKDYLRSEDGIEALEENCQCFTADDFFNALNDEALHAHGFYDVMCTKMSNLDIAVHYVIEMYSDEDLTEE